MSWFNSKSDIKDKIMDIEKDLRTLEYEYCKACDEKEEADRRNDDSSSWRWECLCNQLERNIDILKDDLKYWQSQIQEVILWAIYMKR